MAASWTGAYIPAVERAELLEKVRKAGSLPDDEAALGAAREVVCALRERLSDEESANLEEALKGDLPELFACRNVEHLHRLPERPAKPLTEPELAERVRAGGALPDLATARKVIRIVLAAVSDRLGEEPAPAERQRPRGGPANEAQGVGGLGEPPKRRKGPGGHEEDEA